MQNIYITLKTFNKDFKLNVPPTNSIFKLIALTINLKFQKWAKNHFSPINELALANRPK